jgi:tetratricopeptide (TPR) repeat protein
MNVSPRRSLYNKRSTSNIYRMFLWALLILVALWLVYGINQKQITPLGQLTPTSTRGGVSYASEGNVYFSVGELKASVAAYQKAIEVDPNDALVWASLARIQTYSSELTTTDEEKRAVLDAALKSIDQAKALAPDDSTVAAIRAFVLDWNANPFLNPESSEDLLFEAEQEAARARQLDNTNILALAYYAEILIDQQKLAQAEQYILQALDGGQDLMDVHRVYALLLESQGAYNDAIEEYEKAILLMPNMTFLHLRAGANYRRLAFSSTIDIQQKALYEKSLEYFDAAAKINEQLGVKDPIPYLSISKTYSQMGEYFAAGRNVQKALDFKPKDADIYGQLGIIFFQSRNYEGAIPALKCAVRGCTPPESCDGRYGRECDPDFGEAGVEVRGLPLSSSSLVYYYTYGSVMAALSRPKQNYCPEAVKIFQEVRDFLTRSSPNEPTPIPDTTVIQIVEDGEAICRLVGQPAVPRATVTPLGTTLEPSFATETPTPGE